MFNKFAPYIPEVNSLHLEDESTALALVQEVQDYARKKLKWLTAFGILKEFLVKHKIKEASSHSPMTDREIEIYEF